MNCEALSLTGERNIIATAIHLLRQNSNDNTGEFETVLQNIDDVFLQTKHLLQVFDISSSHPGSAASIAAYVINLLLEYRRTDVLIQMDEVSNLFTFF